MEEKLQLFRRRFLPNELIWLKDDELISFDDETIVTKWKSLSPRTDFASGLSTYYRKKGVKVTKIFDINGNFSHWYCDIVRECSSEALNVPPECIIREGTEVFLEKFKNGTCEPGQIVVYEDLLADVVVKPNGDIYALDLDELNDCHHKGLITDDMLCRVLSTTAAFLEFLFKKREFNLSHPEKAIPYDSFEFVDYR